MFAPQQQMYGGYHQKGGQLSDGPRKRTEWGSRVTKHNCADQRIDKYSEFGPELEDLRKEDLGDGNCEVLIVARS